MLIKLVANWFAPTGQLLRKGVHNVPDDFLSVLPKRTVVLKEPVNMPKIQDPKLKDYDLELASAEIEGQLHIDAHEAMAKAREALAAKRAAKKAAKNG